MLAQLWKKCLLSFHVLSFCLRWQSADSDTCCRNVVASNLKRWDFPIRCPGEAASLGFYSLLQRPQERNNISETQNVSFISGLVAVCSFLMVTLSSLTKARIFHLSHEKCYLTADMAPQAAPQWCSLLFKEWCMKPPTAQDCVLLHYIKAAKVSRLAEPSRKVLCCYMKCAVRPRLGCHFPALYLSGYNVTDTPSSRSLDAPAPCLCLHPLRDSVWVTLRPTSSSSSLTFGPFHGGLMWG